MKLSLRSKIGVIIAYGNYLLLWINVAGILFLALNYQKLFEHFNSSVVGLIGLVSSLAILLTGKKSFEIRLKSFREIFSSPLTWIPNIIILGCVVWLALGLLFPPRNTINIVLKPSGLHEGFSELIPLRGRAELYAVKNNSNKLISAKPFNGNIEFDFIRVDSASGLYVKLEFENKYDRISINRDSLMFSVDSKPITDTCYISVNKKNIRFDATERLPFIEIHDVSGFGKYRRIFIEGNTVISIINGKYYYILKDKLNNERYSDYIVIDNNTGNGVIRLPQQSTDVTIHVANGILHITGSKYLGTINIKNEQVLRFLNNASYEYTLSNNYYKTKRGVITANDIDQNGMLNFSLKEKKNSKITFYATLPDGLEVPAKIYVNGEYYGTTANPIIIPTDSGYRFSFSYTDTSLSRVEKFTYECVKDGFDIYKDSYMFPIKLELKKSL